MTIVVYTVCVSLYNSMRMILLLTLAVADWQWKQAISHVSRLRLSGLRLVSFHNPMQPSKNHFEQDEREYLEKISQAISSRTQRHALLNLRNDGNSALLWMQLMRVCGISMDLLNQIETSSSDEPSSTIALWMPLIDHVLRAYINGYKECLRENEDFGSNRYLNSCAGRKQSDPPLEGQMAANAMLKLPMQRWERYQEAFAREENLPKCSLQRPVEHIEGLKKSFAPVNLVGASLHALAMNDARQRSELLLLQGFFDVEVFASPSKESGPVIELHDSFFARISEDGSLTLFDLSGFVPALFVSIGMGVDVEISFATATTKTQYIQLESTQAPLGWEDSDLCTYKLKAPTESQQREWTQIFLSFQDTFEGIRDEKSQALSDNLDPPDANSPCSSISGNDVSVERGSANWAKDNSSKSCGVCRNRFTLIRRRHHCRICGHLRCSECSRHRQQRTAESRSLVRVCNICVGPGEKPSQSVEGKKDQSIDVPKGTDPAIGTTSTATKLSREARRRLVVEELIASERLYVLQLVLLARCLSQIGDRASKTTHLERSILAGFSSTVEHILRVHQLLISQLERTLMQWSPDKCIGPTFRTLQESLEISYIQLAELIDSAWEIVESCGAYPSSLAGSDCVPDFLLMRLDEYRKHLGTIAHETPVLHDDADIVAQTVTRFSESLNRIADSRRESGRIREVMALESEFCHQVSLSSPTRRLICTGETPARRGFFRDYPKRVFHLFDDTMLRSRETREGLVIEKVYRGSSVKVEKSDEHEMTLRLKDRRLRIRLRQQGESDSSN